MADQSKVETTPAREPTPGKVTLVEAAPAVAPEPGKQSLLEASLSSLALGPSAPGKRTLNEELAPSAVATLGLFDAQVALARAEMVAFAEANAARNVRRLCESSARLRHALELAAHMLSLAEQQGDENVQAQRAVLTEVEAATKPLFDAAFTPSRAAVEEFRATRTFERWDADVRAWQGEGMAANANAAASNRVESSLATAVPIVPIRNEPRATNQDDPTRIAARGIEGLGERLPFLDRIQSSFGRHDISSVRAHLGGAAARAARRLGARAFAFGNHIAFDGTPDLHTAAHEAAHHVQQRAGIALKGGIDQPGDEYEHHADAVADAVVRGDSAEPLLDQMAGRGASASPASPTVVQRKTDHAASKGRSGSEPSWWGGPSDRQQVDRYLARHERKLWHDVERYFEGVEWPAPHPRLSWRDSSVFVHATVERIRTTIASGGGRAKQLATILTSDPVPILAPMITSAPLQLWVPAVGLALAQLIEPAIVASLRRLGPRWVTQAETAPEPEGVASETKPLVAAESLIATHPIDVAVRVGLTTVGALDAIQINVKAGGRAPLASRGFRKVTLQWQGWRDPALWNWVKAIEPADATAEEVAAMLWPNAAGTAKDRVSPNAHRLTAAPPMFGVPPTLARSIAGAQFFAPARNDDGSEGARYAALAGSVAADDLALTQAATRDRHASSRETDPAKSANVLQTLDDSLAQLHYLVSTLARWRLAEAVSPGLAWAMRKRTELAVASATERAKWRRVLTRQKSLLYRITGSVRQLATADGANSEAGAPIKDVLAIYARAAASAHLGDASAALIAQALDRQQDLTLQSLRATGTDLKLAAGTGNDLDPSDRADVDEHIKASRALQGSMLAGRAVDPAEVELTLLGSQELALRLRVEGIRKQLRALQEAARQLGQGWVSNFVSAFHSKFRSMDAVAQHLDGHLQFLMSNWDSDVAEAASIRDPKEHARAMRRLRPKALARAQARFDEIQKDQELVTFLREGASTLDRHAKIVGWTKICAQLALMIGISMVASAAGSAVARGVGTAFARADMIKNAPLLARTAGFVARGTGVAVEAGVNTAGNAALGSGGHAGEPTLGEMFVENALSTIGSAALLKHIGDDLELAKSIERNTATLWARTKTVGKIALAKTATISSHVIINTAMSNVARQVATRGRIQPTALQTREWFLQGASVAIGRYVHGQLAAHAQLRAKLALLRDVPAAQRLLRDAAVLERRAAAAERTADDRLALELLGDYNRLLSTQESVLSSAAHDPAQRQALGMSEATLGALARKAGGNSELRGVGLELVPLHSAGLEELVPGEIWAGTPAQIEHVIASAKKAALPIEAARDANAKTWRLTIDGHSVTVNERTNRGGAGRGGDGSRGDGGGNAPDHPSPKRLSDAQRAVIRKATSDPVGHVDPSGLAAHEHHLFQTREQQDAGRWGDHGIDEAAHDAEVAARNHLPVSDDAKEALRLKNDPEFRRWYGAWKTMPDRIVLGRDGSYELRMPEGVPPHVEADLRRTIPKTNLILTARAIAAREQIVKALPGANLDPRAAGWAPTRKKLVEMFGEDRVASYERNRTEMEGAPDRTIVDQKIENAVSFDSLKHLRSMLPGLEIYVTGSTSQPSKKGPSVDLDIIVVVPEHTPQKVRAEMERRLWSLELQRPRPQNPRADMPLLPVDAKVMTPSEFAGLAVLETPAGRTPLNYARIDTPSATEMPGIGRSGIDLHNHIMGVGSAAYFTERVGGGSAVATLEKAWAAIHDPKYRKGQDGAPVSPTVLRQLGIALADVRNSRQVHMPVDILEARAQRALDDVLAASHETPFDQTYDLRELLVDKYIDPQGTSENYATDVLGVLHDQGTNASEQSVSLGKLQKRFTAEAMEKAHRRAAAQGRDVDLSFLVMMPTSQTLSARGTKPKAANEALRRQLMRPDVKGLDIAGPEATTFTARGMRWLVDQIKLAREVARAKGEPMVIRPHVGEGYDPAGRGHHVEVARKNLDMILGALKAAEYSGPGDGVIVRFGHAAHATPDQLRRMGDLGLIVEANVGSNLATGSVLRAEDHPLLANMYYGVSTVLSTDGQGVMQTTLPIEYQRAAALITQFRSGQLTLQLDGQYVRFNDLTVEQQSRFSPDWLAKQAIAYRTAAARPVSKEP
ncbi:MAG: DUF4157 domain-containing protein [Kofleriaceae bacterium]|nr:DUF4157 domain-containing protein [Kofleriaceae bacterium]